jgi:hypothetical protein
MHFLQIQLLRAFSVDGEFQHVSLLQMLDSELTMFVLNMVRSRIPKGVSAPRVQANSDLCAESHTRGTWVQNLAGVGV